MKTFDIEPPVIAHRGASAYAPENTIAAFKKAHILGIRWVEFDVMLGSCGTPIIFHDERLERVTNGSGYVSEHPYAALRTLDAGSWFDDAFQHEPIPTLADVLHYLHANDMCANIEIKPIPSQVVASVQRIIAEVTNYYALDDQRILFSSFSLDALKALRQLAPQCHMGLLIHDWFEGWETLCQTLDCVSVHVYEEILNPATIAKIKQMQKLLLSYTVNDLARARQLYRLGVDAVFSDCPDRILQMLAS